MVAVAGFALTGFSDFAGHHSHTLLIFAVNPLHNAIHLVLAIAVAAAAPRHRTARLANLGIGVVLGLVTVLGFFGGLGILGMSGLGDPDNFLHLATATLALYFGSVAAGDSDSEAVVAELDQGRRRAPSAPTDLATVAGPVTCALEGASR